LKAKLEEALKPIEKRLHDLEERFTFETNKYQTFYQNLNAEFKEKY
jgi:5'-deoxynucleotidase YfbR-like HD superfamily hydrolase